jgi:NAD(P)-dependent dehydrogenase (short-subunit alcohol dehydrogenase family)
MVLGMAKWTAADIPDQSGRVVVITGANSGIGAVAARELARAGARVVLAVRNTEKGAAAAADMPGETEVRALDLSDLSSVRAFAADLPDERIDLLINNAGVMALPFGRTADGFETQIGTNHLGHFALTGLLLDRLKAAEAPRVVTLSSTAHKMGRINFDDLHSEKRYSRWPAYGQSKLANLLFTYELQRRADAAGLPLRSMAAHPGYAATNLQFQSAQATGRDWEAKLNALGNKLFSQDADHGALPTLFAATVPDLPTGSFIGPDGVLEGRGHPKIVASTGRAQDRETARRLWEVSEEQTGVRYDFARAPAREGVASEA